MGKILSWSRRLVRGRTWAGGGLPNPTDESLTGFLQTSPARSKNGLAHAKLRFAVAQICLRSDADTGDSPKSTDDSLTDFLRISRTRSKSGLAHAETLFEAAEICSCAGGGLMHAE